MTRRFVIGRCFLAPKLPRRTSPVLRERTPFILRSCPVADVEMPPYRPLGRCLSIYSVISPCRAGHVPRSTLRVCRSSRSFCTSHPRFEAQQPNGRGPFRSRLSSALRSTKIEWKPIPVALGVGFLGALQFYRIQKREQRIQEEQLREYATSSEGENGERVPKRKRVRPSGPWQVQIMSTLPLKALSRLWGWFNEQDIPYYFRVPGFKLYSWIFGVK